MTAQSGGKTTAILCAVMYQSHNFLWTEQNMFAVTTIFGWLLLQSSHLTCFVRAVEGQVFPGQPSRTALPCPGSSGGRSSKGSKLQHTGSQLHHCTALHWPTEHRLPWLQKCLGIFMKICPVHLTQKWPSRGLGWQQPWHSKHCWRWWVSVRPQLSGELLALRMLQNKAKITEAHLGCINQVEDASASTCLHHLWFTATSGQDCFLEQPGATCHARVRHLVGENQQSVTSLCCLDTGQGAQQC